MIPFIMASKPENSVCGMQNQWLLLAVKVDRIYEGTFWGNGNI